jgi:hypothetical protein
MDMTLFGSLVFKVANATEQLRAVELRRQVYTEEFGHATGDELDQRAYHLIACNEVDEVVATMRVIGPEQRPFDIEEFVNLAEFIAPGRSVAVTGGLCVRRDCRTVSSQSFISPSPTNRVSPIS